jgi:hypothetical protein
MGGKLRREWEQILFYTAVCLILFLGGCSFIDTSNSGFMKLYRSGEYERAYAVIESMSEQESRRVLFRRLLLTADPESTYYNPQEASETADKIIADFPDSPHASYALGMKRVLNKLVCADNLNETLTDTVEGTVKLLDDREEALDEMTHSINEYEAIHEKIVSKNSELRNAVRHLKKENEALTEENTQLKKQLEMMKEVDLKTDRK